MKKSELIFGLLKIPVDFFATVLAFILAYKLRAITDLLPGVQYQADLTIFPEWSSYLRLITVGSFLLIMIYGLSGMYSFKITQTLSSELKKIFLNTSIWLMLIIAYYFMIRGFPFSRLALVYSWIFSIILIGLGRGLIRFVQKSLLKFKIGQRRILILGNNYLSKKLFSNLKNNPIYKIIGILSDENEKVEGVKIIGGIKDLESIVKEKGIEEIIQTRGKLSETKAVDILNFCREHHLQYHFVPDLLEVHRTNIEIIPIAGIPLISLKPTPLDGWGKIIKRTFDLLISILGLTILSPLFLIIAIIIKLDSRGPVFFRYLDDGSPANRIGQKGRPFQCLKFRTMKPKTHNMRYCELADRNIRKGGPLVKIASDPRVTAFGKFLRKTSLDELPQLWNVLIGSMSLVGPRPHLPEEVAKYQKHHLFVLTIKPGITGLAQVSGRSDLDFEEEIRLDTYYIQNWSLWLDLKIIFKTFFVVLKRYEE